MAEDRVVVSFYGGLMKHAPREQGLAEGDVGTDMGMQTAAEAIAADNLGMNSALHASYR